MAVTFDWYSFKQSQKAVEHGVVHGGNSPFPPPSPPPPQHLPSTRVPLLFVSERICTSKNPLAFVACSDNKKKKFITISSLLLHSQSKNTFSRVLFQFFEINISAKRNSISSTRSSTFRYRYLCWILSYIFSNGFITGSLRGEKTSERSTMFRSFLMGIIKQRDFPGWVSGENGSLRGPRRRKAPRVSITRQLRTDTMEKVVSYGFETPFRAPPFSSKSTFYPMTLFITSLSKKYDCSKSLKELLHSILHFQFQNSSSINRGSNWHE